MTLDGRDLRFHRDCGEFVWLAAMDAGIAGPFYWVRASKIAQNAQPSRNQRATRIKAAQAARRACAPDEYDARLGELLAVMKEGRRG